MSSSAEAPVAIKFDHVTKTYKLYENDRQRFFSIFSSRDKRKLITKVNASNDLSFEIKKGEAVAFLGHNGAGKSTALKMITDMERIGDQATDIAEISLFMEASQAKSVQHIGAMAVESIRMVNESVEAFVKSDLALADRVIKYDDVVDDLFCQVRADVASILAETPALAAFALDVLMIAKYLERIADHATNIAEWVEFSVTGSRDGIS